MLNRLSGQSSESSKYVATFDISKVFAYLASLPLNSDLSLQLLSYKTLFLLTASSLSSMSSVSRLGSNVEFFEVPNYLFFDLLTRCFLGTCSHVVT